MAEDVKIERTCRYGHGPLQLFESEWANIQLAVPVIAEPDAKSPPLRSGWRNSGRTMLVRLWLCPTCGTVELADEE